ncbi:Sec1-binding region of Mso1-domain-containing protein [Triangularia verruculosa]|uniref:Sec1-binding region of Mso1-domain-containing protein n=1 Tax=Triangularia verruculosa TaxID=2587418 RepID=A0AAN6XP93_9PEZI|nr:Sec1-binding region of Mso1-domain-containing protein [Triangularia verruculosa]
MASWYSSLLTNASTNITKLQRTYFAGESDGDTEDDTHVCRVLRNYYTEKGSPFPGWLPPDPKAPPPQQPVLAQQQQGRYGGLNNQAGPGGSQTRLNSLWDNNKGGQQQGQQQQQQQQGSASSRNPFAAGGQTGAPMQQDNRPQVQSLRTGGSYQGSGRPDGMSPTGSAASGTSAQEKLKQRLWGGGARTTSPSAGGPFQPPAPQQQQAPPPQQAAGGRRNWGGAAAPEGGYSSRRDERPVMSANAPWADGGFEYPASGNGGGGGRSYGLPSGPRGGLPSGPRPR